MKSKKKRFKKGDRVYFFMNGKTYICTIDKRLTRDTEWDYEVTFDEKIAPNGEEHLGEWSCNDNELAPLCIEDDKVNWK